eukprot:scaffold22337_cov55-Phaeocystis_antarctica.AAC.2
MVRMHCYTSVSTSWSRAGRAPRGVRWWVVAETRARTEGEARESVLERGEAEGGGAAARRGRSAGARERRVGRIGRGCSAS